jgi:hypothetical protein
MHVNALLDAIYLPLAGNTDVFGAIYAAAHEHIACDGRGVRRWDPAQMPEKFPRY